MPGDMTVNGLSLDAHAVVTALGEVRDVLTQIRDVLAYASIPPAPVETPGCPHPEPDRVNLSSMSETRWKCRKCQYEHVEPRLMAGVSG